MPRYFFDTDDGSLIRHDQQGIELADDDTAKRRALDLLRDLLPDLPSNGRTIVACVVRDGGITVSYRLMLTVDGEATEGGGD